jgi:polyferredoxin
MSQTAKHCTPKPRHGSQPAPGKSVPLKVLRADGLKVKPSRSGPWRAAILIIVHLIIIAHVIQWLITGMTVSPVEPSESMYTLELGRVNAGFIFFVLAILSTLILGRFLCGWGCHVVALQDFCSWIMKKCGVHPKPFRSRLLILFPLGLALYMFVWPTFRREVIAPIFSALNVSMPAWMGTVVPFPGFSNAVMTENFWATFPPWFVAIPFLFVCGFAIVYFMGAKAFCSFGCPYGGFFGVADRVAPGRILVNDNCEGCGHCTAVCTSNVRVHEEVRDFGMVVDPGCMKCMDCVSVCPNQALHFGFAKPAMFVKPRTAEAAERRRTKARNYDLTLREDIAVALLMLVLIWCFRGMFNAVPLLMAMALAAIAAFFAFKLWRITRDSSVRLSHLQIKNKGKLTRTAFIFIPAASLLLAAAAWSGVVRFHLWRADTINLPKLSVTIDEALTPGFIVPSWEKQTAERVLRDMRRAGPISQGGFGWAYSPRDLTQKARAAIIAGDFDQADQSLSRTIQTAATLTDELPLVLAQVLTRRNLSPTDAARRLESLLAARKEPLPRTKLRIAALLMQDQRADEAEGKAFSLIAPGTPADVLVGAAELILAAAQQKAALGSRGAPSPESAAAMDLARKNIFRLRDALRSITTAPNSATTAPLHQTIGGISLMLGDVDDAMVQIRRAIDLDPTNPTYPTLFSELLRELGRTAEAADWAKRAQDLQTKRPPNGAPPPPFNSGR